MLAWCQIVALHDLLHALQPQKTVSVLHRPKNPPMSMKNYEMLDVQFEVSFHALCFPSQHVDTRITLHVCAWCLYFMTA